MCRREEGWRILEVIINLTDPFWLTLGRKAEDWSGRWLNSWKNIRLVLLMGRLQRSLSRSNGCSHSVLAVEICKLHDELLWELSLEFDGVQPRSCWYLWLRNAQQGPFLRWVAYCRRFEGILPSIKSDIIPIAPYASFLKKQVVVFLRNFAWLLVAAKGLHTLNNTNTVKKNEKSFGKFELHFWRFICCSFVLCRRWPPLSP